MPDADNSLFADDTPLQKKSPRKFKARSSPPLPQESKSFVDVQTPAEEVKPAFKGREKPRDLSWEAAIRNLGPILHPEEKAKYPEIFAVHPDLRRRIQDWKQRHGI